MNLRNALCMLLVLGLSSKLAAGQQGPHEASSPDAQTATALDLRVRFTGYLLGYYRVPDIQPTDFLEKCPDPPPPPDPQHPELAHPADLLLQELGVKKPENTILVGMGGNFGVEIYSRTYRAPNHLLIPKPRNSQDPHWTSTPASKSVGDNVGCFLSLAGYDAITPGKEDFYYGPERLWRIAQRLAAVPESDKFHPVHMLASNLVVQTTYLDEPPKVPDSAKRLRFEPGLPEVITTAEISDHGTVLPFLRTISVRATAGATLDALLQLYLCAAPRGHADEYSCGVKVSLKEPVPDKEAAGEKGAAGDKGADADKGAASNKGSSLNFNYPIPDDFYLQAGSNYQLCAVGAPKNAKPQCIRFSVEIPYFQSCELGDCAPNQYDLPYLFIPSKNDKDKNVVIYGVVDSDLKSFVGRDNLSWENTNPKLRTEVAALDPLKALHQAQQLFEKNHPKVPRLCKVLLAEMSRAKAEELAENLDFDVVIAAARPYDHATTNRQLTLSPKPKFGRSDDAEYPGVVVVPWEGQATKTELDRCAGTDCENTTLFNPLRQLDLKDYEKSKSESERRVTLSRERFPAMNRDETWRPKPALDAAAGACVGQRSPAIDPSGPFTANDAFVKCTLRILREKTHADVALMQKRDFYAGPFREADDAIKNALGIERVLWTGDILQVVTVTGDTLQKVLKESAGFDQQDLQATQEKTETGRGFFTLGIGKTEDDQYVIDGDLLDSKRLYTVSTTNHITAGDTGYPELNDPQLANKQLPRPGGVEGIRISELVCEKMFQTGCVKNLPIRYPKGDGNSVFASRQDGPAENQPSHGARVQAWFIHSLDQPLIPKKKSGNDGADLETKIENRPIWRFSLVQASFTFQESINNLSEKERALLFTGFSAPGINGANAHTWQVSKQAELVRSGKWLNEYVRNQLDYSSQVTEQIAPALPSISRSKNRDQFDAGLFFHPFTVCKLFLPCPAPRKEFPKIGVVFEPFRFDSPVAQEELVIGPKTNQEKVNLERTQNVLGRAGVRIENAKSHFEAGYEIGWERGALVTFFAGSTSCPPLPDQSSFGCLTSLVPPVRVNQIRETRDQRGFYVDYAWTTQLPLHLNWKNIVQIQGEWFPFGPSNDNSSDTRKLYDINEKLSIPLFASPSFQPGGEYYLYRNKFGVSSLIRWTPSASLTWSFDRYSGGKWGKSLGYSPNAASGGGSK
jgi:5'-nucleotidase, C-terminal domain